MCNCCFSNSSDRHGSGVNSGGNSGRRRRIVISCEVALGSTNSETITSEEAEEHQKKIGARIKVTAPVKVYHVAKLGAEVDLCGLEGNIKQYVAVWKEKRISANLPYKVEFVVDAAGGPVKFFAHLKEDEFQFL